MPIRRIRNSRRATPCASWRTFKSARTNPNPRPKMCPNVPQRPAAHHLHAIPRNEPTASPKAHFLHPLTPSPRHPVSFPSSANHQSIKTNPIACPERSRRVNLGNPPPPSSILYSLSSPVFTPHLVTLSPYHPPAAAVSIGFRSLGIRYCGTNSGFSAT
jgi:hypothetical protein